VLTTSKRAAPIDIRFDWLRLTSAILANIGGFIEHGIKI
jgi:hypothetical protein